MSKSRVSARTVQDARQAVSSLDARVEALETLATASAAKLLAIKTAMAAFAGANKTVDRTYDCDAAVVAELCDVVMTLIDDIELAAT